MSTKITIAAELEKLEGIKRQQAVYRRQYDDCRKNLRTIVLNGETTGDTIKDYLLAIDDFENRPLEATLRGLSQKVSSGVGEELGIVYLVTRHEGQTGCFDHHQPNIVWKQVQIGTVSEPLQFNFQKGEVIIPAREKPIIIDKDWLYCIGEGQDSSVILDWASKRNTGMGDNDSALAQILFGEVHNRGEIKARTLILGPGEVKKYSKATPYSKHLFLLEYSRQK